LWGTEIHRITNGTGEMAMLETSVRVPYDQGR
jgi:hypothetical protein